jgi:signal transduction histidine kinase
VDLVSVVSTVVGEIEASHRDAKIELVKTDEARGFWDAGRLAQVASNLIENAIKHGDGHDVRVAVRTAEEEVVFEVHNQGAPIPEELMPRLFQPFSRPRGEARGMRGGLGLGLYIAHQIVLGHGGTLDVESAVDSGTTFRVRLPGAG